MGRPRAQLGFSVTKENNPPGVTDPRPEHSRVQHWGRQVVLPGDGSPSTLPNSFVWGTENRKEKGGGTKDANERGGDRGHLNRDHTHDPHDAEKYSCCRRRLRTEGGRTADQAVTAALTRAFLELRIFSTEEDRADSRDHGVSLSPSSQMVHPLADAPAHR